MDLNIDETDKLKRYVVLSYVIDNPDECIKKAINLQAESYISIIISHNDIHYDNNNSYSFFKDFDVYSLMINNTMFESEEEIMKTAQMDETLLDDILEYAAERVENNSDDAVDYLIKNNRNASFYGVSKIDTVRDEIYEEAKKQDDFQERLKKTLLILGYCLNIDKYSDIDILNEYSYFHYSETEDFYVQPSSNSILTNFEFMFDYIYSTKIDELVDVGDQDMLQDGISYVNN